MKRTFLTRLNLIGKDIFRADKEGVSGIVILPYKQIDGGYVHEDTSQPMPMTAARFVTGKDKDECVFTGDVDRTFRLFAVLSFVVHAVRSKVKWLTQSTPGIERCIVCLF